MEQDLKNKILFAIHTDQQMSYFETFWRESLQKEKDALIAQGSHLKRDNRKAYEKKVDKIIKGQEKDTKKFLKNNYKFVEQIESNMSEENRDSLENLCIKVGELMELLMDNAHNEDINILLSLYKQGHLEDFLTKIKNDADNNKKDTELAEDTTSTADNS